MSPLTVCRCTETSKINNSLHKAVERVCMHILFKYTYSMYAPFHYRGVTRFHSLKESSLKTFWTNCCTLPKRPSRGRRLGIFGGKMNDLGIPMGMAFAIVGLGQGLIVGLGTSLSQPWVAMPRVCPKVRRTQLPVLNFLLSPTGTFWTWQLLCAALSGTFSDNCNGK